MRSDQNFLALAYLQATASPDLSNQNGAVLVVNDYPVFSDYNRFPDELEIDNSFLTDRNKKLRHIGHAEANTLSGAARYGHPAEGGTLYCPWAACGECAKPIIFSGIKELVVHTQRMLLTPERWKEDVEQALAFISSCGIIVRSFNGPVGGPVIRVNGELWQP